jgi:mRNA-degrading endonuclease HigB of HigAB toxin-antitoxin module
VRLFGIDIIEKYAGKHAAEREILAAFKQEARAAIWKSYLDLSKYNPAIKAGMTLLKIGSHTRLTAVINYPKDYEIASAKQNQDGSIDVGRILVTRILTHEEYNQIDWSTGKRIPKRG